MIETWLTSDERGRPRLHGHATAGAVREAAHKLFLASGVRPRSAKVIHRPVRLRTHARPSAAWASDRYSDGGGSGGLVSAASSRLPHSKLPRPNSAAELAAFQRPFSSRQKRDSKRQRPFLTATLRRIKPCHAMVVARVRAFSSGTPEGSWTAVT